MTEHRAQCLALVEGSDPPVDPRRTLEKDALGRLR